MRKLFRRWRGYPKLAAAGVAGGYLLFAVLWIVSSSAVAASRATSLVDLRTFETWKGVAFVLVTAGGLYAATVFVLRRFRRDALEIIRTREAFLDTERRARAGLLARSIGHDINNVLSVLDLCLGHASERIDAAGMSEVVTDMKEATKQLAKLAGRLHAAGDKGGRRSPQAIDLADAVDRVVPLVRMHRAVRTCQLDLELEEAPTRADPDLVSQILWNLTLNAADACDRSGRILIRTRRVGGGAVLEVHDSGPGVPPSLRERIFEPLYTTKTHGTGLGLVSARWCAESHGGGIEVETSRERGGACFRVTLPENAAGSPGDGADVAVTERYLAAASVPPRPTTVGLARDGA